VYYKPFLSPENREKQNLPYPSKGKKIDGLKKYFIISYIFFVFYKSPAMWVKDYSRRPAVSTPQLLKSSNPPTQEELLPISW
jgi:hypothetical protein